MPQQSFGGLPSEFGGACGKIHRLSGKSAQGAAADKSVRDGFRGGCGEGSVVGHVDYLEDAKYYKAQGKFETSLTSVAYCEGLLDALRLLGAVKFEWPTNQERKKLS